MYICTNEKEEDKESKPQNKRRRRRRIGGKENEKVLKIIHLQALMMNRGKFAPFYVRGFCRNKIT